MTNPLEENNEPVRDHLARLEVFLEDQLPIITRTQMYCPPNPLDPSRGSLEQSFRAIAKDFFFKKAGKFISLTRQFRKIVDLYLGPSSNNDLLNALGQLLSIAIDINITPIDYAGAGNRKGSDRVQIVQYFAGKRFNSYAIFKEMLRQLIPNFLRESFALNEIHPEADRIRKVIFEGSKAILEFEVVLIGDQMPQGGRISPIMALILLNVIDKIDDFDKPSDFVIKKFEILLKLLSSENKDTNLYQLLHRILLNLILSPKLKVKAQSLIDYESFDLQSLFSDILLDLANRLAQEITDNQPLLTLEYVKRFAAELGIELGVMITELFKNLDDELLIATLKQLSQTEKSLTDEVIKYLSQKDEKVLLFTKEIAGIVSVIPTLEDVSEEAYQQALERIFNESETVSFDFKLQENIVGTVSLDEINGEISLELKFTSRGSEKAKIVRTRLTLSIDLEYPELSSLDGELDSDSEIKIKQLIKYLITRKAPKEETKTVSTNNQNGPTQHHDQATPPVMTRAERIARYNMAKQTQKTQAETKKNHPAGAKNGEPEAIFNGSTDVVENKPKRVINNDLQTIAELLKDSKIENFTPEEIQRYIDRQVRISSLSLLGKSIKYRSQTDIHLRQLSWLKNGLALRVYLQKVQGDGNFRIVGILVKKGEEMQANFIKKLLTQLTRQGLTPDDES